MKRFLVLGVCASLILGEGPGTFAQRYVSQAVDAGPSAPGLGPVASPLSPPEAPGFSLSPGGLWLPDASIAAPASIVAAGLPPSGGSPAELLREGVTLQRDLFLGNPDAVAALKALEATADLLPDDGARAAERVSARVVLSILAGSGEEAPAEGIGAENAAVLRGAARQLRVLADSDPALKSALDAVQRKLAREGVDLGSALRDWGRLFDGSGLRPGEAGGVIVAAGADAVRGAVLLQRPGLPDAGARKTYFLPQAPAPQPKRLHFDAAFFTAMAAALLAPVVYHAVPPTILVYSAPTALVFGLLVGAVINIGQALIKAWRSDVRITKTELAAGLAVALLTSWAYFAAPSLLIYWIPTGLALALASAFVLSALVLLVRTLYKAGRLAWRVVRRKPAPPKARRVPAPRSVPLSLRARLTGYGAAVLLGALSGLAPLVLVRPVLEAYSPTSKAVARWVAGHPWLEDYEPVQKEAAKIAAAQDIRAIGPAFTEETVRALSENPEGRRVLDQLRDRGGVLRMPPIFIGHAEHADAFQVAIVHSVFIDPHHIKDRGWTLEDFLKSPDKQRLLARELAQTTFHELVHVEQSYRYFRMGNTLPIEYEAYLRQQLYAHEALKQDPYAKHLEIGRYKMFLRDIDGFLRSIDGLPSYKGLQHVETPQYARFIADLRARHAAISAEGYMLLAEREDFLMGEHFFRASQRARDQGLPEPRLASVFAGRLRHNPDAYARRWAGRNLVEAFYRGDASGSEVVAILDEAARGDADAINRSLFAAQAKDMPRLVARQRAFLLDNMTRQYPVVPRDQAWARIRTMIAQGDATSDDVVSAYRRAIAQASEPRLRAFLVEDLAAKSASLGIGK